MKRILIVEDVEIIQTLYRRILEKGGYTVDIVHTRQAALELIQTAAFDCLISDLLLPDGDGCDVLVEFRRKYPEKKIIVVSGNPDLFEKVQKTAIAGPMECMAKPFVVSELLAVIRRNLRN